MKTLVVHCSGKMTSKHFQAWLNYSKRNDVEIFELLENTDFRELTAETKFNLFAKIIPPHITDHKKLAAIMETIPDEDETSEKKTKLSQKSTSFAGPLYTVGQ